MKKLIYCLMALVMALSTACNNENSSEHKNHSNPEADLNEINDVVSELIEKCQDFTPNDVTKGLPGEWALDSELAYNEEWQEIIMPYMFMGIEYTPLLQHNRYTFKGDSTGFSFCMGPKTMEPDTLRFNWSYDVINRKLLLIGEHNAEYIVSGYNKDYIISDRVYNNKNLRTILKRNSVDEEWQPIELSETEFNIPSEGGECNVAVQNYDQLSIVGGYEVVDDANGNTEYVNYVRSSDSGMDVDGGWYRATIHEDSPNEILIVVNGNNSIQPRTSIIDVQCGNVFGCITIVQGAKQGEDTQYASVMSSLPYTEYSLEGTSCEWNFPYDFDEIVDVVIVNSDEELRKYIKSENNASYPDIDFTKQSLVITYGSQNSGIESIHLVNFKKLSEAYYELSIEITPNLACVMSPWTYAFITEKLSDQTQIKLGVILKQE